LRRPQAAALPPLVPGRWKPSLPNCGRQRQGTPAGGVEASETTEREIDVAVRDIITKAFEQATAILRTRRTRRTDLEEGGRLLLAQETLTADQFPAIRPVTKQPETVS
jgi:ATP-dependent Zn protease